MPAVDPQPAPAIIPQATRVRSQIQRFNSQMRRAPKRQLTAGERRAIEALIESIAELLEEDPAHII